MTLEYTLTRADFKAGFRLHRRQKLTRQISIFIAPAVAVLLFAIALSSNPQSELFAETFAFGVGSLVWSILIPFARMYSLEKAYRQQRSPARTSAETTLIVDENHVIKIIPGVAEHSYSWNAIMSFVQDEKVALLYSSKSCFLILPKRAISSAQLAELDAMISRSNMRH